MCLRKLISATVLAVLVAASPTTAVAVEPSRGHQTLLKWGLQVGALVQLHQQEYVDAFNLDYWAESNFTNIDIVGSYPGSLLPSGMPWSMVGDDSIGDISTPGNSAYASTLVRYEVKDEQDITDSNILIRLRWHVGSMHNLYPEVMVHTTQYGWQNTVAELQNYMQFVKPDMLMFDTYPFQGNLAGGNPSALYRDLAKYRSLSLGGNDGTGTHPIPFGLWTQDFTYNGSTHVVSESEIRLNKFAVWAFGGKLTNAFFYNHRGDGMRPIMFEDDGYSFNPTPNRTPQFFQIAETNRQSVNLGPALVRLISTDVRMKMGRHKKTTSGGWGVPPVTEEVDNDRPGGVSSWDSAADPYITSITVTNLGSKNDELRGDVVAGYFKPLDASLTNAGHENDMYFMIVNGLSEA